jgi:hypothetical protein
MSDQPSSVRRIVAIIWVGLSSVAAGIIWDILAWRLHFPYFPYHFLVRLLHVDGESAYTAMMYEMMAMFFVVFSIGWAARRLWSTRRPDVLT